MPALDPPPAIGRRLDALARRTGRGADDHARARVAMDGHGVAD